MCWKDIFAKTVRNKFPDHVQKERNDFMDFSRNDKIKAVWPNFKTQIIEVNSPYFKGYMPETDTKTFAIY